MRLLDLLQPADRAPHDDTDLVAVGLGDLKAGAFEGLAGSDHRELDEARHPARLLTVEAGLRLEADDLARHLARHPRWIERLHSAHA